VEVPENRKPVCLDRSLAGRVTGVINANVLLLDVDRGG
jgi:hypothetical protein